MPARWLDRGGSRRRPTARPHASAVLGIPIPLLLTALVLAALLGLLLSVTLEASTGNRSYSVSSSVEQDSGAGKNSSGLPVVTEASLGTEVQRLVDSGMIQPPTSFDATACLRALGVQDSVLIMEEVAWSADESRAWLLVHGPMDRETLRANGGTVSASVVRQDCGSGTADGTDPAESRLWAGEVMIGSL
ncbi:hypothetical protein BH708_13175 [Brachybacterium sp. P6-10-X1]|nr:hypothetical protein BH708_13175 [Brachybacterium sp. P6-10-X1]